MAPKRTGRLYDMFRLKAVERRDIVGFDQGSKGTGIERTHFEELGASCPRNHISAGFSYNAQLKAHNKIHTYIPQDKSDEEKKLLNSQDFPKL